MVAARFKERGAVLVDADALARDVVEPGSEGLDRVVAEFGRDVLGADGRLDRPKLGALVFGNPARLAALNGIVHPLVRARAAAVVADAAEDSVVVQDIPLLVETGQGSSFHLVVVVDAPDEVRLQRMLEHRGMAEEAARARMAAQATREERLAVADAVLDNSGSLQHVLDQLDRLWDGRLVPFAANIAAGIRAPRNGGPVLAPHRTAWAEQAQRLMDRISAALQDARGEVPDGPELFSLEHIGSTAVPGMDAKDVIDLQLAVPDLAAADAVAHVLSAAGFPVVPGITSDTPKASLPDAGDWGKRVHANADPGRPVNLHVRAAGSTGWRFALCFRDWLRSDPAAAADYLALKRRLAAAHARDSSTDAYAAAKEEWFAAAEGRMEGWAARTGWVPPSYPF